MLIFSCTFAPVAQTLTAITNTNIGTAATEWVTNPTTAATTYGNIAHWDVSAVTNMYRLFYCKPTFNADIGKWNVASVRNMYCMFYRASVFNKNLGSWNTAKVSGMANMFDTATSFNRDISGWNTASVSDMNWMFSEAAVEHEDRDIGQAR